jgi:alpha-glucosidase
MKGNALSERPWWQRRVIYQIYPRSFQDSNGDGVGDLKGILERIDYLAWLGIDAVWISPVYPSPMADFGYDVADYVGIDPVFGTLSDFDHLVTALHRRGVRIILDFVPNHTSDEHPWFREARASRDNPRRNWYIWRDPRPDGAPPNNWQSVPGGSAWEFDHATGQYYCHSFLTKQPDLNWRNPNMRAAMYDVLRFWLDRGVDGFRVDVLGRLIKDEHFRDDPLNPDYRDGEPPYRRVLPRYSSDQPEVLKIAAEMRRVLQEYPDERLLIGEIYLPVDRLVAYYGPNLTGVQLPFNFNLMWVDWNPAAILRLICEYEALPRALHSCVLGNNDQQRVASRLGQAQARVGMVLLMTLRGTPTLYYGDELGLENVPIPREQLRDAFGLTLPDTGQGRDPERTPMPWNDSRNAGFTTGEPWLPLGKDHPAMSVEVQKRRADSMLNLTRALLELRHGEPASLHLGPLRLMATFRYTRTWAGGATQLNLDAVPKVVGLTRAAGQSNSRRISRAGELVLTVPWRTRRSSAERTRLFQPEACLASARRSHVVVPARRERRRWSRYPNKSALSFGVRFCCSRRTIPKRSSSPAPLRLSSSDHTM